MSGEDATVSRRSDDNSGVTSVDVVSLPWIFTQHHPLDSRDFIRCAKERGIDLDELKLRQLYKQRVLVPFVAITNGRQVEPEVRSYSEPQRAGTRLADLRRARTDGRVFDPWGRPFIPRLAFTPPRPPRSGWWNGLIYSQHQLVILPKLEHMLARCRYSYRNKTLYPRLPEPDPFLKHWANWYHRIALMATALEARYLPVLDPEWVNLVNANPDEYERYRQMFDPAAISDYLRYPAKQVREDAEELLLVAHSIEPAGGPWSQLLRRAPRDSWKHLKGTALSAMDLRETAEILLRFYEDLAEAGLADKLPIMPDYAWHPLHERLSVRRRTLDQELMSIGLSPHPRVVLAIEGESEEKHVPRVWKTLGYPDAPELVRVMKLGGTDKDPAKLAGLAATPLVIKKAEDGYWWVNRPPTRFMVAADPEGYYAPERLARTRELILDEIRTGLSVQGACIAEEELNELVELRTWAAKCYEFAHFTDAELADAIAQVHETCGNWSNAELVDCLGYWRNKGVDIKRVWLSGRWDDVANRPTGPWKYEVSKPRLAEVLWPLLERKIELAMTDPNAPVPPVAEVVQRAFLTAQNWRYKTFVLASAE